MPPLRALAAASIVIAAMACDVPDPAPVNATRSAPANLPPVSGEPAVAFAQRHLDIAQGEGAPWQPRQCLYVHYTGWLTDGTKFDSSRDTSATGETRTPFGFPQGARRVIAGWDLGFDGMRVGAKRRLFIPYQLAYGERGRPPIIPPRSELIFDVELMAVADTLPRQADAEPARQPAAPACPRWEEVSRGSG